MPEQQKRRSYAQNFHDGKERLYGAQQAPINNNVAVVNSSDDEITIDLVELMYRLMRSWKLIVSLAVGLALVVGVFTAFFVTPMYEATSIIYVLSNRDSAINMSDLQLGSALTQDYLKVFEMWEVHEEVISNLSLPYSYADMQQMLTVTNDSNTRMLDITVKSPDPQLAADIANEYAQVASQYIAETMSTDKPNIMSVALVPSRPVSPNLTVNTLLGFVLGGVVAVAIVTVRMLMDDKYKTADDIRKYAGLVTLAVVPIEESDKNARRQMSQDRRKI